MDMRGCVQTYISGTDDEGNVFESSLNFLKVTKILQREVTVIENLVCSR